MCGEHRDFFSGKGKEVIWGMEKKGKSAEQRGQGHSSPARHFEEDHMSTCTVKCVCPSGLWF